MDAKIDISNLEGEMEGKIGEQSNVPFNKFIDLSAVTNLSQMSIPRLRETIRQMFRNIRRWSVFCQLQNFQTPIAQRLSGRLLRNLTHFQSNYLLICLVLLMYCILTSPLILLVILGSMYGCYKIKQAATPITVLKRQWNTNEQCIAVNVVTVPLLYLAGAGGIMFWVIGASCFLITLHAAFYNIDALVTEETDGFLAETV